jgi:hypothetical protein
MAKVLTPWTRAAQGQGLGIPYVDYARGDGPAVGPGETLSWTPIVIDDETPWVRDFRGLWGHDTRDRLGGERGPAGPRYDRDGTVRASWGDPVGWAGLAKVAPNPEQELAFVARRIEQIDAELDALSTDVADSVESMSTTAAGLPPSSPTVRALVPEESRRTAARMTAIRLADERQRLVRTQNDGVVQSDPHAHLSHRRTPIAEAERGRSRFLAAWAIVSTPLVLWLVSVLFRPEIGLRWQFAAIWLVLVLAVEAFARGYFWAFLGRLVLLLLAINFLLLFFQYWQLVISVTLAIVAFIVLFVNIKDARGR